MYVSHYLDTSILLVLYIAVKISLTYHTNVPTVAIAMLGITLYCLGVLYRCRCIITLDYMLCIWLPAQITPAS